MKNTLVLILLFFGTMSVAQDNFYELEFKDISGKSVSMKQFKGKMILIVTTASECGFTPQYEQLQELHEEMNDKLVIIGFPCNQFGAQEPGGEDEIQAFCKKNYGVTFLMASKIDVKGEDQHPVYNWLTNENLNGKESTEVQWNFQKYLINAKGNYVKMFGTRVSPIDDEIISLIE